MADELEHLEHVARTTGTPTYRWAAEEIAALREALRDQWEYNHAEHCSNEWPHAEGQMCHWPQPVIMGGDPADYRPYG